VGTLAWIAVSLGVALALYAGLVIALLLAGRRADARALARFIPDCLVLFARLERDPRVPWKRRALLLVAGVWLASPIDLLPEFLPVVGPLDDALVVALCLRALARGGGAPLLAEHWPGPPASLALVERLAGLRSPG
jgi:uncharacterized membrane protein YkvA (DUF1232 family)